MPVTTIKAGGNWGGATPVPENVEIIQYLAKKNPQPGAFNGAPLKLKLEGPDTNGIYVHRAPFATPLYYRYDGNAWWWSPDYGSAPFNAIADSSTHPVSSGYATNGGVQLVPSAQSPGTGQASSSGGYAYASGGDINFQRNAIPAQTPVPLPAIPLANTYVTNGGVSFRPSQTATATQPSTTVQPGQAYVSNGAVNYQPSNAAEQNKFAVDNVSTSTGQAYVTNGGATRPALSNPSKPLSTIYAENNGATSRSDNAGKSSSRANYRTTEANRSSMSDVQSAIALAAANSTNNILSQFGSSVGRIFSDAEQRHNRAIDYVASNSVVQDSITNLVTTYTFYGHGSTEAKALEITENIKGILQNVDAYKTGDHYNGTLGVINQVSSFIVDRYSNVPVADALDVAGSVAAAYAYGFFVGQ